MSPDHRRASDGAHRGRCEARRWIARHVRGAGHCAMEVVAWLAGLGHTDAPECASPVLRSYTISLNDQWDEETLIEELIPFLPRMVGTAGDGQDGRGRILRSIG